MAVVWLRRLASATLVRRPPARTFFYPAFQFSSYTPLYHVQSSTVPLPIKTIPCGSVLPQSALATPELCGRGDRKTKKGKRFRGTYGKARPKKDKKIERIKEKVEVPSSTPWPLPFKLI